MTRQAELSQYMTPLWVAEALVERHFGDLDAGDMVLEPSCGKGSFLKALPIHVPAIGCEIDPELATIAAIETGRRIVCGDFRTARLDVSPTVVIGNPPFAMDLIDAFLQRSHALLPAGGRVGFILPAYAFQTAKRVAGYSSLWSIATELIPRNIYKGLREPLMFTLFSKDERRVMVGLALYREAADVQEMPNAYREIMTSAQGSLWRAVCQHALERLGGTADLAAIYRELEGHRPTRTKFWREKIRQTLYRHADCFRSVAQGRYTLHDAGHLSVIPARFRALATGDLSAVGDAMGAWLQENGDEGLGQYPEDPIARQVLQSSEAEAIAWQYAAACAMGLPEKWLFPPDGFDGEGPGLLLSLKLGQHLGVNGLQAAQWTHAPSRMNPRTPTFPVLSRWLAL